jgi:hypothetical protein
MNLPRCCLVLLLFFLVGCGPTRPEDLPPFPVEIDTARDTILHTPNGALIHISPHALEAHVSPDGLTAGYATRVRLIIRQNEDFIDIEPAKDQPVTFTETIYVALPTTTSAQNRYVYKGIPDPDGHLRFWKDPQPLFTHPASNEFLHGRELFSNNCQACHSIVMHFEIDPLYGVTQRHDQQWLRAFTRDNEKLRTSGDPYANALYNQFNKTPMPAFPDLSDADIDDIYRCIDEYYIRRHPPFPDSVLKDHPNGYYQFPINTPGWYHIDTRPPSHP